MPTLPTHRPRQITQFAGPLALNGAWVILGVLLVRVIYLIWLSPWELVGDEAYYWEWSRHLDWCYYEKGPGQAFLIWPFVKLFGVHAWAVRLPVALLSAGAAWMVGRMATRLAGGNSRAGLLAIVLFCITPAMAANAQLCTQDAMIILVWAGLSASGLTLVQRWEGEGTKLSDWVSLAVWMGVGFLFKQSVLLFVPSVIIYAWMRRRMLKWNGRVWLQALAGCAVFGLFVIPMLVWNARHGWPTLAHTLGHLGAGGDREGSDAHWSPMWFVTLVGSQIGAVGPGGLALMGWATWRALRRRDDERYAARLWLVCAGWPSVLFFVALSGVKSVIGSWPFPAYVALMALVGEMGATELLRSRPKPAFTRWWDFSIIYGLAGCFVLMFPHLLVPIPLLGKSMGQAVMKRCSGQRENARKLDAARAELRAQTGSEPMLVTRYYMNAALDAFYLPDHPTVYCAGTAFGKRRSAYDFWAETDLKNPALIGKAAILDSGRASDWSHDWNYALKFDQVEPRAGTAISVGSGYRGVVARNAPAAVESSP